MFGLSNQTKNAHRNVGEQKRGIERKNVFLLISFSPYSMYEADEGLRFERFFASHLCYVRLPFVLIT